jgi:hypothetical protein
MSHQSLGISRCQKGARSRAPDSAIATWGAAVGRGDGLSLVSVEGHADLLLLAPDDVTGDVRAVLLKDKVEMFGDVVGLVTSRSAQRKRRIVKVGSSASRATDTCHRQLRMVAYEETLLATRSS